jgi:hypothetical protein
MPGFAPAHKTGAAESKMMRRGGDVQMKEGDVRGSQRSTGPVLRILRLDETVEEIFPYSPGNLFATQFTRRRRSRRWASSKKVLRVDRAALGMQRQLQLQPTSDFSPSCHSPLDASQNQPYSTTVSRFPWCWLLQRHLSSPVFSRGPSGRTFCAQPRNRHQDHRRASRNMAQPLKVR